MTIRSGILSRPVPALRDCARECCRGGPLDRGTARIADSPLPRPGSTFVLEWKESSRNFVIREVRWADRVDF